MDPFNESCDIDSEHEEALGLLKVGQGSCKGWKMQLSKFRPSASSSPFSFLVSVPRSESQEAKVVQARTAKEDSEKA